MYCQVFFAVKCVKLLRSKVCVLSKVFFDAKCASAGNRRMFSLTMSKNSNSTS